MRIGTPRQGGVQFRTRDERPLTDVLPTAPAAVRVYGPDGACAALCLDLDTKHGGPDAVAREEARLVKWLEECGARVVTDVSPNGGRHVYVPLTDRLGHANARELVEALASLFPTLDPSPHRSLRTGCIRPPGARHASSWGHQQLTMSLNRAVDVLHRRNDANVVRAMQTGLRREIATWRAAQTLTTVPYLPDDAPATADRRRSLSGRILRIARDGDTTGYSSGHEARQAVMSAAVAGGWRFVDVVSRIETGRWPGLASLYTRYSPGSRAGSISRDWRKAEKFVASTRTTHQATPDKAAAVWSGNDTVHRSNTSLLESRGGRENSPDEDEHALIRTWRAVLRTTEVHRLPGRRWYTGRFLLRALGEAAHKSGSRAVQFGTRALAVATGVEHTTVSVLLHQLADAGWVDRLEEGRGENADTWILTLPTDLAATAPGLRWDRGRIHALRPAFRELGHVAALVFEAVETGRARTITQVSATTGISRRSVHDAVDTLSAWNLLDRSPDGLTAHPDRLVAVAEHLGALDVVLAQLRRYARHRTAWHSYLTRHDEEANPRTITDAEAETWWWPPDDSRASDWTIVDTLAR